MKYIATAKVDNDEIIKGNMCCTNLQELYAALVDQTTEEIVFRKDFTDAHFTPSALYDFIENAASINEGITITTEESVVADREEIVDEIRSLTDLDDFINALIMHQDTIIPTIKELCNQYDGAYSETLLANNKMSTLHMQYINLMQKYNELKVKYDKMQQLKDEYANALDILVSRINYKYNKPLDVNKLMQINLQANRYNKILYIKEVTRVKYTDTFIYYLSEILKTLYDVPTRYVVIEPFYTHQRASMYPKCKPHYDLTYSDVRESDIFMAGFQSKLMEAILSNPSHINYLIILDRCGYHSAHVVGDRVEYLYSCSDPNDLVGDIPLHHVISYSPETLHIANIRNFSQMSLEEKTRAYADMEITKSVIKLIERR